MEEQIPQSIVEKEVPKKEEKKSFKLQTRVISILVFAGIIIALIIAKIVNEDFPIGWIIFIGVFSLIGFLLVFFVFDILKKHEENKQPKKEGVLPKPITIGEAQGMIENIMLSPRYGNGIEKVFDDGVEMHGKKKNQLIYFSHFKAKFPDFGETVEYFIGVNMHFPKTHIRVLTNPQQKTITMAKKNLATDSEDEPDKTIIEETNPMLGIDRKITKIMNKQDKLNQPVKKPDLE